MSNTLKSEIAPKGLKFNIKDFMISGKIGTILTVISYPKSATLGFLSYLTNLQGVKLVAKHIPIEFSTIQSMLNKEVADLKMRYQSEKDQTNQKLAPGQACHSSLWLVYSGKMKHRIQIKIHIPLAVFKILI